jgi:uroporphyrin-III C-methyltransferase
MSGKVYLVGAGPGDPELLTLKALRALQTADVVLHDDLVTPKILALAASTARVYNVGKRCGRKKVTQEEINARMVAYASDGLTVVRLKGGDPLIFSRAGEEMDALQAATVPFEVVPGVTAASAAAAAARIPLTDRRLAARLAFFTAHHCAGKPLFDWPAALAPDTTIVLYMPGNGFLELAGKLTRAGLDLETPCLIISRASTPDEQIHRTILAELSQAPRLPPPTILIIGAVTALGRSAELFEATGARFKG